MKHLGSLKSTQEARVARGVAESNSYASFVLSKLLACFTLTYEPIVNCWACLTSHPVFIYLFISTICADWPSLNGGRFQGFPVVKVVLNENTRPRVLILFYMRLVTNWLLNFTACYCVKRVTCAWGMSIFSYIYISFY